MAAFLSPSAKQQFFDNAGAPAAGHKLYTYAAGTANPLATYTDRAGTVANTNPITLDARGEAIVYLPVGVVYDYQLKTAGGVEIWTRPGVSVESGDFTVSGLSRAQAVAQGISDLSDALRTIGYAEAGDGGAALYKRVSADPAHGGAFQSADGQWWELAERTVTPEMFGAVADIDTDSATALAAMVSFVNATHAPIELRAIYRSNATLAFTTPSLAIFGCGAGKSGIVFGDCDGITHAPVATQISKFSLRDFALIPSTLNTRTGFASTGTGNANIWSDVTQLYTIGEDRYRNPALGASSCLEGWNVDLRFTNCRRVRVKDNYIQGAEAQIPTFGVSTAGIAATGCNHLFLDGNFIFCKETAFIHAGAGENHELTGNALVANDVGISIQSTGGANNDHNITRNHISSFTTNIDLYSALYVSSAMHNIQDNLLFVRDDAPAVAFKHIVVNADGCVISGNYFLAYAANAPAANAHIAVEVLRGKGNRITGNFFDRQANCVTAAALSSFTLIDGNHTTDDANTLVVAPIIDLAATTYVGINFGDRIATWNSIAHSEAMWSHGTVADIYADGAKRLVARFADAGGTAANYIQFNNAVAGNPVQVSALGTDTNIDLRLSPKGSGVVRHGTFTASGDVAVTGSISIKDDGGTVRKLAVVA